jgi:hypothetical protein
MHGHEATEGKREVKKEHYDDHYYFIELLYPTNLPALISVTG